jgi:hypothetical protein
VVHYHFAHLVISNHDSSMTHLCVKIFEYSELKITNVDIDNLSRNHKQARHSSS